MADFVSEFWNWWIIIPTILGIAACFVLIHWLGGHAPEAVSKEKVETMGHVWDEDLEEYNNPLPRWWLNMFYITLFFGIGYLLLYPGLGTYAGVLGWTQNGQYDREMAAADLKYGPLFEQYQRTSAKELGHDKTALAMGRRLFASYCTVCHGSDARGVPGFPNLTDGDWLYGGEPAQIEASILHGRAGTMPAWKDALGGDEGVHNVAQYVLSLSERKVNAKAAEAGKTHYQTLCAACHMPNGAGNIALGAPNLRDNVWLYGGSPRALEETIAKGRKGRMPAHGEFLGKAKVHLLAAYIYSLSQ